MQSTRSMWDEKIKSVLNAEPRLSLSYYLAIAIPDIRGSKTSIHRSHSLRYLRRDGEIPVCDEKWITGHQGFWLVCDEIKASDWSGADTSRYDAGDADTGPDIRSIEIKFIASQQRPSPHNIIIGARGTDWEFYRFTILVNVSKVHSLF